MEHLRKCKRCVEPYQVTAPFLIGGRREELAALLPLAHGKLAQKVLIYLSERVRLRCPSGSIP